MTTQAYGVGLIRSGALYLLSALVVGFIGGLAFEDDVVKQRLARSVHISAILEGMMQMLGGFAIYSGLVGAGASQIAYYTLLPMWFKNAGFTAQIWLQCPKATPLAFADAHVKSTSCTPTQESMLFVILVGSAVLLFIGWGAIAFSISVQSKRKSN